MNTEIVGNTIIVEFTGGAPSEADLGSKLYVNETLLNFESGGNAVYNQTDILNATVTVTGLDVNAEIKVNYDGEGDGLNENDAKNTLNSDGNDGDDGNVFYLPSGTGLGNEQGGLYAVVKTAGIGTQEQADDLFKIVRVDDDGDNSYTISSDQSGLELPEFMELSLDEVYALANTWQTDPIDGSEFKMWSSITPKSGHMLYQNDSSQVAVLAGGKFVIITDSQGESFMDPTMVPSDTNQWLTEDPGSPGSYVSITLDQTSNQSGGQADATPEWVQGLPIDGKPIYQDDNLDSPSSTFLATDTGGASSVKVIITNDTGAAYTDPTDLPLSSASWYTDITPDEDGDNSVSVIPINFNSGGGIVDGGIGGLPSEAIPLLDAAIDSANVQLQTLPASAVLGWDGNGVQDGPPAESTALYNLIVNGAGADGGIGLTELTGKTASEDLDGNAENGIQSISSTVVENMQEAKATLMAEGETLTVEKVSEVMTEAFDETIEDLLEYNPELFSS
jgi:hypothetical protein